MLKEGVSDEEIRSEPGFRPDPHSSSGITRRMRVKRLMMEVGVADRELQNKLPVGERLDVTLKMRNFWMFKKTVGELTVASVSPTRELIRGEAAKPMDAGEVNAFLRQLKQSAGGRHHQVPPAPSVLEEPGRTSSELGDVPAQR